MDKYLYAEIYGFCIVMLASMSGFLRKTDKSTAKSFLHDCIIMECFFFFVTALQIIINGNPAFTVINYILSAAYFVSQITSAYLWLRFVHLALTGDEFSLEIRMALSLPLVLMLTLCIISCFNGMVFVIDENGFYERGPYYVLQASVTYAYLFADMLYTFVFALRAKQYLQKRKAGMYTMFIILPAVAAFFEIIKPGLCLVCLAITFTMIFLIFNMQMKLITLDSLTQLNNRYRMMDFLDRRIQTHYASINLYMMYIDINDFKYINDHYGHPEGDRALCLLAESMRDVCRNSPAFAARVGGDEFVIIFDASSYPVAEAFRANLKDALSVRAARLPYKLTISAGIACYDGSETADAFVARADQAMYFEKKRTKATPEKPRRKNDDVLLD